MKRAFPRNIQKQCLLLVEGIDECHFFDAMLEYMVQTERMKMADVQIIDVGGKDKFGSDAEGIDGIIQQDAFVNVLSLGFVRDAEDKPARSAFDSLKNSFADALKNRAITVWPLSIAPGRVVSRDNRKFGVFIMPNNNDGGMLEDLCLSAVGERKEFECVVAFMECVAGKRGRTDKFKHPAKRRAQAYLAAFGDQVERSVGIAAKQKAWPFDHACFTDLKRFIIELFGDNP